jgi:hypothetical protein
MLTESKGCPVTLRGALDRSLERGYGQTGGRSVDRSTSRQLAMMARLKGTWQLGLRPTTLIPILGIGGGNGPLYAG